MPLKAIALTFLASEAAFSSTARSIFSIVLTQSFGEPFNIVGADKKANKYLGSTDRFSAQMQKSPALYLQNWDVRDTRGKAIAQPIHQL